MSLDALSQAWVAAEAALPLGRAQGDDARWPRVFAVAGFLKSGDLWLASCSTSVRPTESALLQDTPIGGVCPTCQAADNEAALAIDHLLL